MWDAASDSGKAPGGGVTVDKQGQWSIPRTSLTSDAKGMKVRQVLDGGESDASALQQYTLTAPVVDSPTEGSEATDRKPEFKGKGAKGGTVTIADDQGATLATGAIGTDGTWSVKAKKDLPLGDHTITVTHTADGLTSKETKRSFTVKTDSETPVITKATKNWSGSGSYSASGTGTPGATIEVKWNDPWVSPGGGTTVDGEGNWSYRNASYTTDGEGVKVRQVTNGEASDASKYMQYTLAAPTVLTPGNGSEVTDRKPQITGRGAKGESVEIKDQDGKLLATALVGDNGLWATVPDEELPLGTITITVAHSAGGLISETTQRTFTVTE
ncbi:Ig-like domain-containing protein [Streptomyces sp. NBC_01465]|uniref:Ig-like domain-containing protein n=1 Tax=Streptomyces sp. NBC_01465 TaxID=2903878 RepID=UPI002E32DD53|nr:Ig-like domain-containing protein [Streptomyces sp. NBC_01465]